MKILHLITSLDSGGAEAVLYRLILHDTKNQHIVISMMNTGKYGLYLDTLGVTVYYLNMPRGRFTFSGLVQLWKLIKKIQPDAVQTWMYHANLIGGLITSLVGIKKCFWGIHHSDLSPGKNKFSTRIIAKICAPLSYIIPSKIIVCAEQAASIHQAIGYDKKRIVIIPNGYDLSCFKPATDSKEKLFKELHIPQSVILLGMVARFDPQKDHLNLLRALAILKQKKIEFSCLLMGENIDNHNEILAKSINDRKLSNNIVLLGTREDIPNIMSALDIHILSSIGEAFPNVIAEAMACGTPCITTNVGDAALIVGNTGWVVPTNDSEKLASAIIDAIQIKTKTSVDWEQRQKSARETIMKNYSIEKMVSSYQSVWN